MRVRANGIFHVTHTESLAFQASSRTPTLRQRLLDADLRFAQAYASRQIFARVQLTHQNLRTAMRWYFIAATAAGAVIAYLHQQEKLYNLATQLQNKYTTQQKKPAQFSDLPAELRRLVYSYILEDNRNLRGRGDQGVAVQGPRPNLWRASKVNREMRHELLTSFWEDRMFRYDNTFPNRREWLSTFEGQFPFVQRILIATPAIRVQYFWRRKIKMEGISIVFDNGAPSQFRVFPSDTAKVVDGNVVISVGAFDDDRRMMPILNFTMYEVKKSLKRNEISNKWYIEARDFLNLAEEVQRLMENEMYKRLDEMDPV